jgi:putative ABC transport system permease protein
MLNDLRYGLRLLRRSPGFTTVAILTLALGIGVNTAIFSLVDAALWRPLPYLHAERLVEILRAEDRGMPQPVLYSGLGVTDTEIWRDQRHIFEDVERCGRVTNAVLDGHEDEQFLFASMTPGFAAFLGVSPRFGRLFAAEEAKPGNDPVVLISERFWRRAFGGAVDVLGKKVTLDRRSYTIVGVLPELFRYPNKLVDAWKPFTGARDPEDPGSVYAQAIGRLRPGLSIQNAQRQLDQVSARLNREMPRPEGWGAWIKPLAEPLGGTGNARTALYILLSAVGFVLLLACANVINMLLARSVVRQRELAIRSAIGASRWRLIRQVVVESGVLAIAGGSIATLAALWATPLLGLSLPENLRWLFQAQDASVDARVLGFALAVSTFAALACGLVPAARASRSQQVALLGGSGSAAAPRRRLRTTLAAAELALTLALLAGVSLLVRSFIQHARVNPGFDTAGLVVVDVNLPRSSFPARGQQNVFYDELLTMARQLPGVRAATMAIGVPPSGGFTGRFEAEDVPVQGVPPFASIAFVEPDYFETLGIPVFAGRRFGPEDGPSSPPVAIISRAAGRRFWPGQSAIGRRIRISPGGPWTTVVGEVGDVVMRDYASGFERFEVYQPLSQQVAPARSVVLRMSGDSRAALKVILSRILEGGTPRRLRRIGTVEEEYSDLLDTPRFFALIMGFFAVMAVVLAAVGLYGVLAYSVSHRTREIGVRMALGAAPSQVRRMVLGEAAISLIVGGTAGLIVAWWLTTFLKTLLYGITPHDPWAFAGACLMLVVVALAASYLPARRASKVDPAVALRSE